MVRGRLGGCTVALMAEAIPEMNEPERQAFETAPPPPATIERHRRTVYAPMAMLAAMQLDLFAPLKDGPMSAEALAGALGVDSAKLRPLLYLLVTAELLTADRDGFANTPETDHYLVRSRPGYLGEMHRLLSTLYRATLLTSESIRTGMRTDRPILRKNTARGSTRPALCRLQGYPWALATV